MDALRYDGDNVLPSVIWARVPSALATLTPTSPPPRCASSELNLPAFPHRQQVYEQDGWKSSGREKLKPTAELLKVVVPSSVKRAVLRDVLRKVPCALEVGWSLWLRAGSVALAGQASSFLAESIP